MSDFLLELFCEEIPARMQAKASEDLARLFGEKLAEAGLTASGLETHATPRRLALIARGLPQATPDVHEERRGPRADAPAQAVEGFLKSTGLSRDQLEERDDPKGRFLYAVIAKPGRATTELLAEIVPAIVRALPWPKSMRWGTRSAHEGALRWVRPLHGIVAILGDRVVDLEVDGIRAGRTTRGHRFLSTGPVEIASVDVYAARLRDAHVILDAAERARIIGERARDAAKAAGLELIEDAGLLAENAGLTEWPVPLLGDFDPDFLDVPPEVIQLTMRANQKYFACRDPKTGALAPAFVCVANIEASDGGAAIVAGNRKVLAARLSDARFFWEQDKKATLESRLPKLGDIVFHEKLGTVADKVERVAKLARWLAGHIPGCDPDLAEQAARLCKADLVTGMVGEFPELQGIMGGYYARAEGLDPQIADAIRDHYKPVGQNDDVPTAPVTVAVALADKLDTLAGFFSIGEKPTGSRDPFALRRSTLGIASILIRAQLRIGSVGLFRQAEFPFAEYQDGSRAVYREMLEFLIDRLKVQQREAGARHDLIDAVFALGGEDDLVRLLARVKALQAFVATDDGANLLAGYKRAANILRIEEKKDGVAYDGAVDPKLLAADEEQALAAALDAAIPAAESAVGREDFAGAMTALAGLRAPIDNFFDRVTVNADETDVRANRLRLLARIRAAAHTVADFGRIEG
ncbi:MAG: glycine--tRNA ligase subunit beta [Alphaproteobacteria bacterium]|nr:glycine--tRNA ligase subunit beta [Alphaproteobacteria bacterium]